METETNFKIYNTLQQLEQGSLGGGSGPPPGSVTGGPGGSIANGTITNINIAPGTITGGPGGNIGTGTVTGGPGGNIAANTITAGELAPGAAAANINSGPAGSINSSQISGGPFLSTAGGTMTGAITQPLAPVAGTDLANKTYVDSLSGPKAFAKFIKQVPQNMTAGTETVITWPIQETPAANATSAAGNITMAGSGVATLTSSTAETAWRVVFSGQSIQDPTTAAGRIDFDVFNNTTSTSVGNNSAAFCFSGALPQAFTDAFLQEYFILAPSATVSFSIRGTNPGANVISLGTSGSNTNPLLCIEQIY